MLTKKEKTVKSLKNKKKQKNNYLIFPTIAKIILVTTQDKEGGRIVKNVLQHLI